ncbi:MAG: family 10 glycosylhydrolase, partial [Deltaproteobacteria bacterium]|nr:family 10 glycosylhydrolase [Deltaproteobacteria bacterium]
MRVILVLILVLALTTLCAQDVAAAEDGPPTLRAAQFLRVEAASEAELEDTIFQLRSQGVDTLIVRMFQNVGERRHVLAPDAPVTGVYFSSKRAPVVMDLLGSVIRVARSLGMRVFAWMPTCTCDWAVTEHPEWRDYAYDPVSGVIQPIPRLDPFHPEVQAYLEELYKEVAAHEIDGILIQDDLISRYNQG